MSTSTVSKRIALVSAVLLGAHLLSVGCTSGGGGGATRPAVTVNVPADDAMGVVLNSLLSAVFDTDMDPATIDATTFTVVVTSTLTPVSGTVTYDGPTRTATFEPVANLASSQSYTATITTGAKNTSGVGVSPAVSWTFETGVATDSTQPTVVSTVPVDTATDIDPTAAITATFDEPMDPASISGTTFTLTGTGSVAGTVTYDNGTLTATFTPSTPLADSTTYTADLTAGARDQAQNALVPTSWSFTTADLTAPTVASSVPSPGATGIALNAELTATFSEDMDAGTIDETSVNVNNGVVTGSVSYDGGSRTVTFTPDSNLSPSTTYFFYVETTVQDVAGNTMAARYTASFTTVDDAVAPTTTDLFPDDTATGVATNTLITVTFSEPMDASTINGTNFSVSDGGAVTGTVTYDAPSRTATFTPDSALTASTAHSVTLLTAITDLVGNPLTVPTWSFTTGTAPDSTAPSILSWTPDTSATDVSVATHQVIAFSEPMNRASVQGAFSLTPSPANPSQFFWNDTGDTVTVVFDTTSPVGIEADDLLDVDTIYTPQVDGTAEDLAGNALTLESIDWDTLDDISGPTIASTLPDVSSTVSSASASSLVITFSEPMDMSFAQVEMRSETEDERFAETGGPDPDLDVSWTDTDELTLDFGSPNLDANTAYAIRLNVSDLSGNRLEDDEFFLVTVGTDSGNPSVLSTIPGDNATNVNPDSLALVTFSRTMGPDITDHISVSGNGSTLYELSRMVDPPGVLVYPLQAWPGNTTITVTVASTATDASGNSLLAAYDFSFTTAAQTTNSWGLDSDYNERKDGDVDVRTDDFEEEFLFEDSAGNRVFMNEQTLAAEDVTVREEATGIPIKGFNLEADEDGGLELWIPGPLMVELTPDTAYEIVFNSSLRNSHGASVTPTTLDFTTSDGSQTLPDLQSPDVEMFVSEDTVARDIEIELRASDDDGDTLTVTVASGQSAFSESLVETSTDYYEYESPADQSDLANGLNTLTFTIDDGSTGPVTLDRDIWNFYLPGNSGLPTSIGPTGLLSDGLPTYTFSIPTSTRNVADILFLYVVDIATDGPALFTILPTNTTSFDQPFDSPLPPGDYVVSVGGATFSSGTTRGDFNGFVIGYAADIFTVPVPGTVTQEPAVPAPAVRRAAPTLSSWKK